MSTIAPSRATLADVIELISKADLPKRQKQDMRSAVRTIAKLLGTEPAAITVEPAALRRRLDELSPEAYGLSRGRLANIRSLLGRAITLVRPILPSRTVAPLSPEWEALATGLAFHRRVTLLPLLRFLSSRAIGPRQVASTDLTDYRDAIFNDRLRKKPQQTWDHLTWVWNGCAGKVEGWSTVTIERPSRRETYVLSWSAFPPSLKDDVDRFRDRLGGVDASDDGPPRPARPATVKTREYQLRVAASALVHRGQDKESIRSVAHMLSLDRYQEILRFLRDRHGGKTSPQVGQIAAFLKDTAKHWVKVDEATLDKMRRIASRLAEPSRGMTSKNRERLRPFDDPKTVAAFLGLPQRIRNEIEADKRAHVARPKAVLAQMAAAIALLQVAPIRLKNLASLDINKHLIARGKKLYLVIGEHETKNQEPIDFELPADVVDILSWYVRTYRPLLLAEASDALFPGKGGKPKSSGTLAFQIPRTVRRFTGLKVNVHLFRHAGGKIFLDMQPGQYEVVRRVLGHKSIATTTRIYTGAETKAAGQHFARVIADRRRAGQTGPAAGVLGPANRSAS